MAIINIKTTWVRRSVLVAAALPFAIAMIVLHVLIGFCEAVSDTHRVTVQCWRGHRMPVPRGSIRLARQRRLERYEGASRGTFP